MFILSKISDASLVWRRFIHSLGLVSSPRQIDRLHTNRDRSSLVIESIIYDIFHFELRFFCDRMFCRSVLHLKTTCISGLSRTICRRQRRSRRKSSCQNICQLKRPLREKSGPVRRYLREKNIFWRKHYFYIIVVKSVASSPTFISETLKQKFKEKKTDVSLIVTQHHFLPPYTLFTFAKHRKKNYTSHYIFVNNVNILGNTL